MWNVNIGLCMLHMRWRVRDLADERRNMKCRDVGIKILSIAHRM